MAAGRGGGPQSTFGELEAEKVRAGDLDGGHGVLLFDVPKLELLAVAKCCETRIVDGGHGDDSCTGVPGKYGSWATVAPALEPTVAQWHNHFTADEGVRRR